MSPLDDCTCSPLPEPFDEQCPRHGDAVHGDGMLLLRLAAEDRGRVDVAAVLARGDDRASARACRYLLDVGYIDSDGWITSIGYDELEDWVSSE